MLLFIHNVASHEGSFAVAPKLYVFFEHASKSKHTSMMTLSLNAVNGLQLSKVKAPQASEPTFESRFKGHREERQSVKGGMRLTQVNDFLHF